MYNIKEKNAQVEGLTILELNWKKNTKQIR